MNHEQSAKDLELAELRAQSADLIGQLQAQHVELLTAKAREFEWQTKYEIATMGPGLAQTALVRKQAATELEAARLKASQDLDIDLDGLTSVKLRDMTWQK